jgi:D-sedoheptulose 7-phosphate isomerase
MEYINKFLDQVSQIANSIDRNKIENMVNILSNIKKNDGRLFFIGVGGSAANCSHAVNDFRKIGNIETYSPLDNVAEITARTNDEGWNTIFAPWLELSKINKNDGIFVFSVGGGNKEKDVSVAIVEALDFALEKGSKIIGIVGRDGGYTAKVADECIIIPTMSNDTITPHAESWQGVIWHLLVSHPKIMSMSNKWESIDQNLNSENEKI